MSLWSQTTEEAIVKQFHITRIALDVMGGVGLWEVARCIPSDIALIRRGSLCRSGPLLYLSCRYIAFVRIILLLFYWIALGVHEYQDIDYTSQALSIFSIVMAFQILTFRVTVICGGYPLGLVVMLQASLYVLAVSAISQIAGAWFNKSFKLTLVVQLTVQSFISIVAGIYGLVRDRRHTTMQQLLRGAGTGHPRLDLLYLLRRTGILHLALVFLCWVSALIIQVAFSDPTHHLRQITGFAADIITVISAWRVAEDLGPELETYPITFTTIIFLCLARLRNKAISDDTWCFWRRRPNLPVVQNDIEMESVVHSSNIPTDMHGNPVL
ncbi:hypothetical protein OBBRIDRAFT_794304 [Obba rivulosa]|uniref:Uncharacterized protein n=1 Tax=Obba rivulosa TaxID=1052685 RepID=A0A8E2DIL3_9APHY|nr:hypothetical protein OBBRIDRAFT_794304 [Obba rivulosa]